MYDDQQQLGDGQDNYLRGAQKIAEAAKQAGTASAAGTAGEAAANTAAATVKAVLAIPKNTDRKPQIISFPPINAG